MYDPLYQEIVTNTSELLDYASRHIFIELVLPLSIFIGFMLTFFVDWSWMPNSSFERARGTSLEEIKKNLYDKGNF